MVVPDVVTSLSHERVIVSEFVARRGFEELKTLPQAERDRIGEMIFRFYFGCMYRHLQFSGDPHPGNSLLLGDGRMAFLDFGLFKRIRPDVAEYELQSQRLGIERRGDELIDHLHRGGLIRDPARYTPEGALQQFDDFTWWYTRDEEIELTPEIATARDDRDVRPALVLLRADAPRDAAAGPPARPAPGDARARRPRPAAQQGQLAPDRARVDLRRPAGHGARPAGGRAFYGGQAAA